MSDEESEPIPTGWLRKFSRTSGREYFVNAFTHETRWVRPTQPAEHGSCTGKLNDIIQCSHLLIKHINSRRPFTWKEEIITRSKVEALQIIADIYEQLVDGKADFKELASKYSDCSSAKKGGDLGVFGRGTMQKNFEEVAFALKIGEMSSPVFTDSGIHLIIRTA